MCGTKVDTGETDFTMSYDLWRLQIQFVRTGVAIRMGVTFDCDHAIQERKTRVRDGASGKVMIERESC